jgi:hypothetical protein
MTNTFSSLRGMLAQGLSGQRSPPPSCQAPHLRVLLRAFITCDLYGQSDVVATHYAGEDNDNNQSSEEILLSVANRLEEVQLPELALRLALCSHIRIPNENEIDHLAGWRRYSPPNKQRNPLQRKRLSGNQRLPKAKQQRRRPQSESLPNPTEGPAMAPPPNSGGDHDSVHVQAEAQ